MGATQETGILVLAVLIGLLCLFQQDHVPSDGIDWKCENPQLARDDDGFLTLNCPGDESIEQQGNNRLTGIVQLMLGLEMDLNQATEKDLQVLPRIGPVIARRIIKYRKQRGPFHSIDELLQIKGIGPKTLSRIEAFLKIER